MSLESVIGVLDRCRLNHTLTGYDYWHSCGNSRPHAYHLHSLVHHCGNPAGRTGLEAEMIWAQLVPDAAQVAQLAVLIALWAAIIAELLLW